jgi:hypothetical protein
VKIGDVTPTKKELVRQFLLTLPDDEVMTATELTTHIPMPRSSACGALSGAAASIGMESIVVGRVRHYGTKKAIKKLRDHLENK